MSNVLTLGGEPLTLGGESLTLGNPTDPIWDNLLARFCPTLDSTGNGTSTIYNLDGDGVAVGSNNGTLLILDPATDWVANTDSGGVRALDFDYTFDGTEDVPRITLASGLSIAGKSKVTLACWIKAKSAPSNTSAIYYEATTSNGFTRFGLYQTTANKALFVCRDTQSGSAFTIESAELSTSNWTHIGCVFDSDADSMTLYINGTSVGTNTASKGVLSTGATSAGPVIGAYIQPGSGSHYSVNLLLDDVCLFDRALSGAEISDLASDRGYIAASTPTLSSATTDASDASASTASVAIRVQLTVNDASDTTIATASGLTAAQSTTSDASDATDATASVVIGAGIESTDDNDLSLVVAEQFGWFAQATQIDDHDVTVAIAASSITAQVATVEASDTSVLTADNLYPSLGLSTTDAADSSTGTISVKIVATSSTVDSSESNFATLSLVGRQRRRGFVPQHFSTRSFMGV